MENKATLVTTLGDKQVQQNIYILEHISSDSNIEVRFNSTVNDVEHRITFDLSGDMGFTLYEGWAENDNFSDSTIIISNETKELGDKEPIIENVETDTLLEGTESDMKGLIQAINNLSKIIIKSNDRLVDAIAGIDPDV